MLQGAPWVPAPRRIVKNAASRPGHAFAYAHWLFEIRIGTLSA
jgi:hypothetical protein